MLGETLANNFTNLIMFLKCHFFYLSLSFFCANDVIFKIQFQAFDDL